MTAAALRTREREAPDSDQFAQLRQHLLGSALALRDRRHGTVIVPRFQALELTVRVGRADQ